MFAIIIDNVTAPLIAAMNNGVIPEIVSEDPHRADYFIYENEDTVPYILSSEDFWEYRKENETDWNMIHFGIWTK